MKKKKILFLSLFLVTALICSTLTGCNDAPVNTTEQSVSENPETKCPYTIFNFDSWKLQMPIANDTATSVKEVSPEEIKAGYVHDEYFYVSEDNAVVFRSPVNGFHTANTTYSRSELRELIDPNSSKVNWSYKGTHELTTSEVVTEVPSNGRVVTSQIHGIHPNGDNGAVLVKVEYEYATKQVCVLLKSTSANKAADFRYYFDDVNLGQRYDTKIKVVEGIVYVTISSDGRSETFYHDFMKADPNWANLLFYFKVGNYVQDSVLDYEGEGATVKVYSVETRHDEDLIEPVPIEGLTLAQGDSVNLRVGERTQLKPVYTPVDTLNKDVTWEIIDNNGTAYVDKDGYVTAVTVGDEKVRVYSNENHAIYADCTIHVNNDPIPAAVPIYEQDFETDSSLGSEWTLGSTNDTVSVGLEQDGSNSSNNILKFTDNEIGASAKTRLDFEPQTGTTTVSFKIRVDRIDIKNAGSSKEAGSCIYAILSGVEDGFSSSSNEMFRIRNISTITGGVLGQFGYVLSNGYLVPTINTDKATYNLGDWVDVTMITTPDNGTAYANKSDVYMNGYLVGSKMSNTNASNFVDQLDLFTGTKDLIDFSIDDIKVYSGEVIPASDNTTIPTKLVVSPLPLIMGVQDSTKIEVNVEPIGAVTDIKYSIKSGDALVLSNDGYLTAVKAGIATLKIESAIDSNVCFEKEITVKDTSSIKRVISLSLADEKATIVKDNTLQLTPIISPAEADEKGVLYEVVSGFDYATVDDTGLVTAVSPGSARIRITSLDNSELMTEIEIIVITNKKPGTVVFQDDFSGTLNTNYWTTATANTGNTVNEIRDGAFCFEDNSTGGQPKAYATFEPMAGTFSMQFKLKIDSDAVYPTNKLSGIRIAFGSGNITSVASEAFCMRNSADVSDTGDISNRNLIYSNADGSGYIDIPSGAYTLGEWSTITFVTTTDDGTDRANTTDIYINGTKLITGAKNKFDYSVMNKMLFASGTKDTPKYSIDDLKIWAGDYEDINNITTTLVYEEDFSSGNLQTDAKISDGTDLIAEIIKINDNNALHLKDDSTYVDSSNKGNTAKGYFKFAELTGKSTIDFDIYIVNDQLYTKSDSSKSASTLTFSVGSYSETAKQCTSSDGEYFRFKTSASDDENSITKRGYEYRGGNKKVTPGLKDTGKEYELGKWVNVKVVVDTNTKTCDIYIDDVQVVDDTPMSSKKDCAMNSIDQIAFMTGSGDMTEAYVDNIMVYEGEALT